MEHDPIAFEKHKDQIRAMLEPFGLGLVGDTCLLKLVSVHGIFMIDLSATDALHIPMKILHYGLEHGAKTQRKAFRTVLGLEQQEVES